MELGVPVSVIEAHRAMDGPAWLRRFQWHLMGHRPTRLSQFAAGVVQYCREQRPKVLLATGHAPLDAAALAAIRGQGTYCVNYSTDDPWNPAHRSSWFLRALPQYDCVFTTRRANVTEFSRICRRVELLPFGYDPHLFYPEKLSSSDLHSFSSDVMFAGGADRDRAAVIGALQGNGIRLRLYGSYWDRYRETKGLSLGQADVSILRKAIAATRVALCLVRRANRDGQCMRTYEVPAVGACMLVEDTAEHRELFGDDGLTVRYFQTPSEMIHALKELLANPAEQHRLSVAAHQLIVGGQHRYSDRLRQLMQMIADEAPGMI